MIKKQQQELELETQFHKDMLSIYKSARKIGYNATKFAEMIANQGGLDVAKKFIYNNNPTDGFTSLWKLDRLDLTVEALVLRSEYKTLFSEVERNIVQDRLKEYGFVIEDVSVAKGRFIIPNLEPVKRSREYHSYDEKVRSKVVYEYIFNSRTHRWIDENIIDLNPTESRGYQAMGILHHIGLKDKHKGIFSSYDVKGAISVLQQQEHDFGMVIDCLELLTNKDGFQANELKQKEFNVVLFEQGLKNKEYILGHETNFYIITVKIAPIGNSKITMHKYLVYLLENNSVIKHREVQSEVSKKILTEAKREGVKLLHEINPIVSVDDVTMVHYKQDRPNANPWQKESNDVLSGLFEEFTINNMMETIIEDIDSELSEDEEYYKDGATSYYYGKRYERNPRNRVKAIEIHGLNCVGCGFNFEKVYGERGKDFIEIHHLKPLSTIQEEIEINPETDLVPICSNCHRMIHRKKDEILTIEELQKLLKSNLEE